MKNKPLTDNDLMPYGQHRGKKLANVPSDYLLWAYDQPWCKGALRAYIQDNMDVLKSDVL